MASSSIPPASTGRTTTSTFPSILREIIAHEKPEGFTDNHWAGLGRESMCYCGNCKSKFHQFSGKDLPARKNWDDPVYRQWIEWSYQRRLEIWDLFTSTTKAAGGPDCIWSGMLSGNFVQAAASFRDMKELCRRADIIMLDQQGRANNGFGPPGTGQNGGFQENGDTGKRVHGLGGWDKLARKAWPPTGHARRPARFPKSGCGWSEGVAGTIQPWWHHVGGYQEDRRQFQVVGRFSAGTLTVSSTWSIVEPVATVGVVYSQRNFEWYGRDHANELALAPYNGMIQALIRARIPYLPIDADYIDRDAGQFPGVGSSQPGCHVECTGGGHSPFREPGRVADRYWRNQLVRRVWRSAARLSAGGCVGRKLHGQALWPQEPGCPAAQLPAAYAGCGTGS